MRQLIVAFLLLSGGIVAEANCPVVKRSAAVKRAFMLTHPCPATGTVGTHCPGYVVDHIQPLCLLGPAGDVVANMQYQSIAVSYVKDQQERALCHARWKPAGSD